MSLTIKEIYILDYFNKRNTNFPIAESKLIDFGNDYDEILKKLIDEKFLRLSNINDEIPLLTIPELKNILKDKSLKTTGKKEVLVKRIFDNFTETELKKYTNSEQYYIATEAGNDELKKNEVYILNYHKCHFPVEWVQEAKETLENRFSQKISAPEILYFLCQHLSEEALKNKRFIDLRGYLMLEMMFAERYFEKRNALINAIQITVLDLSGCSYSDCECSFYVEDFRSIFIAPYFIKKLKKNSLLFDDFNKLLIDTVNTFVSKLPFSYFSVGSIVDIINKIMQGAEINLKELKPDYLPPKEFTMNYLIEHSSYPEEIIENSDISKSSNTKIKNTGCLIYVLIVLIFSVFIYI